VSKYPGLTASEYASDLGKPSASVRRDLQVLRARGLVRGRPNPDLAREDGVSSKTMYWWVPIP
jgi:predicted ArsR family transcriptional regulator